jgi:hypothetical protein
MTQLRPANPNACAVCPWRVANQGCKPDPHKFYTTTNLKRLWKGLRNGARMSCHPTDPRMIAFEGYEDNANRETTHECTGGLILQQREFMIFQAIVEGQKDAQKKTGLRDYTHDRPNGLTRGGLIAMMERAVFGGTPFDSVAMSTPDLDNNAIGYAEIGRKRGSSSSR